ncbi:hypothetical protein JTB14_013611 [Gonioctena quinquepunctata]|nr:hypothetical protein JTB14_013611 [Gonioctena quinquepunctata]
MESIDTKLNVEISEHDIVDLYRIGAKQYEKSRPILIELCSVQKKNEIFSKIRNLKKSNYAIGQNFAEKTMIERLLLENSLVINNRTYSFNDIKHKDLNDLIMNDDKKSKPRQITTESDVAHGPPPPASSRNNSKTYKLTGKK